MIALHIIFSIISLLLIILAILQGGKTEGPSNVIMGGNLKSFSDSKERGPEVIVIRITMVLGILYFLLAIIMHMVI